MKRILGIFVALAVVLGLLPVHSSFAADNANNFRISTYAIKYELSRDSESRSVLKTTETITAFFPPNQNHGIERAIPTEYDGHPTSLKIKSVTDANGSSLNYSTYDSSDTTVVRIGDPNSYVEGRKTYEISYEQRDVTRYFQDTGRDEWYWDTNGTEWKVPIDALTVSIQLDPELIEQGFSTPVCYQGASGSTQPCTLTAGGDPGMYIVNAQTLAAGENVSVAYGFNKGTFAAYSLSLFERLVMIWTSIQIVSIPVALLLVVVLAIAMVRRQFRIAEQEPIATEFTAPRDASVMVSSEVITNKKMVFSAQLIDLAVRHFISIVETKQKSLWRPAEYDILIMSDITPLASEEKEIIGDMFGHDPVVGERIALATLKNNVIYSMRTSNNDKKLIDLLDTTYGIREKSPNDSRYFYKWSGGILIFAILSLSIALTLAVLVVFLYGKFFKRLTDKGLALRRYVLGLDKYIKASESERLAFLQGPETAQKVGYVVDGQNSGQILKLYEGVLPYAILFGREKEWSKRLGEFYQQANTQPDWYTGVAGFNAALFATNMQSFSQASNYSAGSSSSSGGSSGGGSSGGGGGGGGGGGW